MNAHLAAIEQKRLGTNSRGTEACQSDCRGRCARASSTRADRCDEPPGRDPSATTTLRSNGKTRSRSTNER